MNKNAKGAIAIGAAVLLLLGGGGTFALWNASIDSAAGQVVSGELSLEETAGATSGWYKSADFAADYFAWESSEPVAPNPDDYEDGEEDPDYATAEAAYLGLLSAWQTAKPVFVAADYPDTASIADIATYQVVPGDVLFYVVRSLSVTAKGSNLLYTFASNVDVAAAAADGYKVTVAAADYVERLENGDPGIAIDLPSTSTDVATTDEYADGTGSVPAGTKVYAYSSTTPKTVEFAATLIVDFDNLAPQTEFNETLNLEDLAFQLKQVVKQPL